VSRSLSSLVIT